MSFYHSFFSSLFSLGLARGNNSRGGVSRDAEKRDRPRGEREERSSHTGIITTVADGHRKVDVRPTGSSRAPRTRLFVCICTFSPGDLHDVKCNK